MTTIHANSTRDCFHRIETMVLMANVGLTEPIIRQQAASAVQVVVHTARQIDGTRKVAAIAEANGQDAEGVAVEEVFQFEKLGVDEDRRTLGRFIATGYRPQFLERLAGAGVHLPDEIFVRGTKN